MAKQTITTSAMLNTIHYDGAVYVRVIDLIDLFTPEDGTYDVMSASQITRQMIGLLK